ncbi:hypothetical protein NG796_15040 [Laspinema sp. A4]|nr:hypothetical protein [Laspinema sp. D2d]
MIINSRSNPGNEASGEELSDRLVIPSPVALHRFDCGVGGWQGTSGSEVVRFRGTVSG